MHRVRRALPALGLLATAGVVATATAEWWVLGLGALAATVITAALRSEAPALPPGLDASHHARATALLTAKQALLDQLQAVPPSTLALLSVGPASVEALFAQALRLVVRHQELERYVSMTPESVVRVERDRLTSLAASATDDAARARYLEAAQTREKQLADAATLKGQAGRLDAEIAAVHARLDGVLAQLLTLRSMQATTAVSDGSRRVKEDLTNLSTELGALAQAYDTLLESPASAVPTPRKERT